MQPTPRVDPDAVALLRAAGCVWAEEEAAILTEAARSPEELRGLLGRRAEGEPLEYIVGWAEFRGIRVPVRRGVFIPRRRSEFLAECAIDVVAAALATGGSRPVRVLDVGCGSGVVGLAVALASDDVELLAVDDSPVAVECAETNLATVGGRVYLGDLFDPLPASERHALDVIIANVPYVPTEEIPSLPAEARLHEPHATLDGGPDGTSVQRRVLESASEWLRPTGAVLIETAAGLVDRTAASAQRAGFSATVRECADLDAMVLVATLRD